jgi:hypothetical protein
LGSFLAVDDYDCMDRNVGRSCGEGRASFKVTEHLKEVTEVPPNSKYKLWCPFCDDWSCRDSMIARKRLGMHVSNKHPEEVRFPQKITPPKLMEIERE